MAIYDNKKYLNLQETVEWCKDQIQGFKNVQQIVLNYGIKVLGHVDTPEEIEEREYEFGDAYLVGTETPYDIYIFTRQDGQEGIFINLGAFAVVGEQGPEGPVGPQGEQGIRGSRIFTGNGSPTSQSFAETPIEGDMYIRGDRGYEGFVYTYHLGDWDATINIRGAQGPAGVGVAGPRGPKGEVGPQGLKGDPGQSFIIIGTITSTNQLPDPTTAARNEAYVLKQGTTNRLYFITGETGNEQWSYMELGDVGTTITEDSGTRKITSIDIQDLVPDGLQILPNDCYMDDQYGLVCTGTALASVRSESKETENAGAYSLPIKDSATVKVNVANNKFTLNLDADMTAKIGKALVTPNSAPTKTKLVGIDTANSQTLIDADSYLPKTFSAEQTLKNTGGTTPLRLESNSGDCWLRFWGSNGQVGELGGNGTEKMPVWWDTTKSYKICLDQSEFTNRNAQNSMKLGNMIINFGNIGSYSSGSGLATFNLTFKTAFSNTNYWIMAVPDADTSDSPQSYDYTGMVKVSNRSNTGCTLSVNYVAGNKRGVTYIAIGK